MVPNNGWNIFHNWHITTRKTSKKNLSLIITWHPVLTLINHFERCYGPLCNVIFILYLVSCIVSWMMWRKITKWMYYKLFAWHLKPSGKMRSIAFCVSGGPFDDEILLRYIKQTFLDELIHEFIKAWLVFRGWDIYGWYRWDTWDHWQYVV